MLSQATAHPSRQLNQQSASHVNYNKVISLNTQNKPQKKMSVKVSILYIEEKCLQI